MPAPPVAQLAAYALLALLNVVIKTPVVDQDNALLPLERAAIESRLRTLRQQRGVQMAVLTVHSTDGESIAEFSHRTANNWGGGRQGYDDGLLLTLATADRQVRIEVGAGLEAQLPNAAVLQILESAHDELQQRKYGVAVLKILSQLEEKLDRPVPIKAVPVPADLAPAPTQAAFAATAPPALAPVNRSLGESEPPPPPAPPLGLLALAPLVALLLGYGLGSWRCAAQSQAIDALAFLAVVGGAALPPVLAGGDPRGFYLMASLGAVGCSSMLARTFGLTRLGCAVAAMGGLLMFLGAVLYQLLDGGSTPSASPGLTQSLSIAVALGAAAQMVSVFIITEVFAKTDLWDASRVRESKAPYPAPDSDNNDRWSSGHDHSNGSGGGGGGGSDWSGGGGSFGGGGADTSY